MKPWTLYSHLYKNFRLHWPFVWLLNREKANLSALIAGLPSQNWTILDIGSGVGHSLNLIQGQKLLIGLDFNKNMAKSAAQEGTPMIVADATRLPIKAGSISLFQAIGLSEYLKNLDTLFDEITYAGKTQPCFHLLFTSSPFSVFSLMRKLTGHRIYMRNADMVTKIAESKGFQLVGTTEMFSQDAFLFRKNG